MLFESFWRFTLLSRIRALLSSSNLPSVVFRLDIVPDPLLVHHLLGGGDGLEVEGGQAVDEPGLLLPDGDPGIVLLGVNQS